MLTSGNQKGVSGDSVFMFDTLKMGTFSPRPCTECLQAVSFLNSIGEMIAKREESFDYEVPRPHALDAALIDSPDSGVVANNASSGGLSTSLYTRIHEPGFFPLLDANVLNRPPPAR